MITLTPKTSPSAWAAPARSGDVSLASGRGVANALRSLGAKVTEVEARGDPSGVFLEVLAQLGNGAGAVADGVFLGLAEFGEGAVVAGGLEDGVVAEAVVTAWLFGDVAFHGAAEDADGFALLGQGEDADEAGGGGRAALQAAAGLKTRPPGKLGEEFGDVVGVGGVFAGVAGGMHAGGAAEGVDFEAGVVGDDEAARQKTGGGEGFQCGVFLEGAAGFVDGRLVREGGEVGDFEAGSEDGGELAGLVRVARGEE